MVRISPPNTSTIQLGAQILVEFEKKLSSGNRSGKPDGRSREKHLLHGHRLFERHQIFRLQFLLYLFELLLGHVAFALAQPLQFLPGRVEIRPRISAE